MASALLFALILAGGNVAPDAGTHPATTGAQPAATGAQPATTEAEPTATETGSPPAPTAPAAAPTPPAAEGPRIERPRNRHVPLPYSKQTTNPSLDAARSTVVPDREALPSSLQDVPLAPLGPAPPDVTPTRHGGGPTRVQTIHGGEAKPATPAGGAAPEATPRAGRARASRRTP